MGLGFGGEVAEFYARYRRGHPPRASCGTDQRARREHRRALSGAGFTDITETAVRYRDELDVDQVVGQLYSAMPADRLPAPADRPAFAESVRRALGSHPPFTEHVQVTTLLGHVP